MNLYLRFYSGSQANIIITDEKNCILDLLYRRPSRNEKSGAILVLDPQKKEETKEFAIRNRTEGSFNKQIEAEYGAKSNDESMQSLIARVSQRRDRELKKIETTVRTLSLKVSANAQYELYKQLGDLLSYNKHIITDHSKSVLVDDYLTGQKREIALDAKLNASANIQAYYNKYQRAKGTWQDSENEYKKAIAYLKERQGHYQQILSPCPDSVEMIRRLQGELEELTVDKAIGKSSPGLVFHSGKFTILVGRNAKENDQLLRHWVKSYDFWMHTRDYPGGYVFIKAMKNKSIPLEALLDAANLAVLYSKAKGQPKVDLYYTQVKFLRRAKDGPLGLVLPTQEKNFAVALDDNRIKRLLSEGDEHANE